MMFSVRRNVAWMAASQAGLVVLQFGSSLVVARLLTPYDMGVFAVATAIAGLISILRAIGMTGYLVRARSIDEEMLASVFTVNILAAVFVAAAICSISVLGGMVLGEPGVQRVLLALAVIPLIQIFELLPATGIERSGDFRLIGIVSLARSVISTCVLLALAFAGFSYMSLAYGQIAGAAFSVIAFSILGRQHVRIRFGLRNAPDIMRYGFQILAISGVSVLAARVGEIVLGRLLGLSALGIYSRAAGLNSMLSDNIHVVIARIVFVDFSEHKRRGLSLRETYLRIVQMITALLWPAFAGMAVLAGPLILTLYGPSWVGAAAPLSLLSLSSVVLVSITMTGEVFVVSQETGRQARFEFVRAGVGFALFAAGCAASLSWAAAARIGEAIFSVGLYRSHLERMTDTASRDFAGIYVSSGLLTLVAVAPSIAVMSYYGWRPQAPLAPLLAAIGAGVLCWAALLAATKHPLAREGQALLARVSIRPFQNG